MSAPQELSRARRAVFDALKIGAPNVFLDDMRARFIAGEDFSIADLEMDSLGLMEFCISVELSTGVSLVPAQLAELATTDVVEARIREQLA
jgi:acyl carrier protein